MAQLSRISLLVPVLTAVQKRVANTLSVPKVRARALGSDKMSPTIKAAPASSARVNAGLAGAVVRAGNSGLPGSAYTPLRWEAGAIAR